MAPLARCRGVPVAMTRHRLQTGVGHDGVFGGKRRAQQVHPRVREVIRTNEAWVRRSLLHAGAHDIGI
jgi:poly-beta-hydroxyalkanoate depolymerase